MRGEIDDTLTEYSWPIIEENVLAAAQRRRPTVPGQQRACYNVVEHKFDEKTEDMATAPQAPKPLNGLARRPEGEVVVPQDVGPHVLRTEGACPTHPQAPP